MGRPVTRAPHGRTRQYGGVSIRFGTREGRLVIAATALGSGIAFLDGTVVNAALPAIRTDFGTGLSGQQWVVTGYLLTLGSLLVVGGSLGDRFGRRTMFVVGLAGFAATSMLCGLAPTIGVLAVARVLQGVCAAALVPASLAMISAAFHPDDRAAAIGRWTGLAGVSTAIGPFLGGWLIDTVSWRWVFFINAPLAAVAVWLATRHVPDTRSNEPIQPIDVPGAVCLSAGLGALVFGLIEGPGNGWALTSVAAIVAGTGQLVLFGVVQRCTAHPMVPPSLFASRRFAGANLLTFLVWGALGTVFFLLTIQLQDTLKYSALEAGAASLPITMMMLLFSSKAGALAQRFGPRAQMTMGPVVIGLGFAALTVVRPGRSYLGTVLPAILILGTGLTATVAPLTATVLAAVPDAHVGLGSAINNAIARVGTLLAIAVLPGVSGLERSGGFHRAMWICAFLAAVGGFVGFVTFARSDS